MLGSLVVALFFGDNGRERGVMGSACKYLVGRPVGPAWPAVAAEGHCRGQVLTVGRLV